MNKTFFFLVLNLLVINSFAQKDSTFFIDDIRVSLNITQSESGDVRNQLGLGIGVYHTFMPEEKFNTLLGVEFNQIHQVMNYMYEEESSHSTDLELGMSALSVLAISRYSVGKRTKAFIEAGVFIEYIISVNKEGILHSYPPDGDTTSAEFYQHFRTNSFSYGVVAGMGMMIPFLQNYLIIKPEYKIGSNIPIGFMDSVPNRYFRFVLGIKF